MCQRWVDLLLSSDAQHAILDKKEETIMGRYFRANGRDMKNRPPVWKVLEVFRYQQAGHASF